MKQKEPQKQSDSFPPGAEAVRTFREGKSLDTYEYFGCHKMAGSGIHTYVFRLWAPGAEAVALVSDFCGWEEGVPLYRGADGDIWELQYGSPTSLDGCYYKYKITGGGRTVYKADPYAIASQTRGESASILRDGVSFPWEDTPWLSYRRLAAAGSPINIYEVHLGSWLRSGSEHNYRELADRLAPYVKQMGYTHVELLPIAEHPNDGSLGYQVGAFYAPTSRYGRPEDLMYFIDKMHRCGVGVLLDWVPAGFPNDTHGLVEFDGACLYEREEDTALARPDGFRRFDLAKPQVRSFLLSNAMYWLRVYHADGLRVSSAEDMLSAPEGYGAEAASFFRELTEAVREEFPSALLIADGASYPTVTAPVSAGGLGFSYAWNTDWSGAICTYLSSDPIYRQYMHDKLHTPLATSHREKSILALSHDLVSGGRGSLIHKMYGGYEEKFAALRAMFTYMMTFPGAKLTFMGGELAQFREWNPLGELEWSMVRNYRCHTEFHSFIRYLNSLYLSHPPLWEQDGKPEGFAWLEPGDKEHNVISYRRIARAGDELSVVVSFSPVPNESYRVFVPGPGRYRVLFRSDGSGAGAPSGAVLRTKKQREGKAVRHYLEIDLPPYTSLILKPLPSPREG